MSQPISILLCALGGEGGGVLADWLVEAALHAGYPAQATSIPGVAQRTGATTYYLEVFPQKAAELGGRKPVFGLNPLPGRLDVLVSSELLESTRQVSLGQSAADRTLLITVCANGDHPGFRILTHLKIKCSQVDPGSSTYFLINQELSLPSRMVNRIFDI